LAATSLHRQIDQGSGFGIRVNLSSGEYARKVTINFFNLLFFNSMNMKNENNASAVKMIVNLGTNPTVKCTLGGSKMARFSAACVEHDESSGKNKIKWYSVISWGKLADIAEKHLQKGKRVMLCGHLVIRSYTDKKGNIRSKREIVATDIVLLHNGRTPVVQMAA
jgi:single-strand DNA-binding protein